MKYIKQFALILLVTFLGEALNRLIPLSIPASVYGMILMYAALSFHVIKLSSVRETGIFLVEIMPVMFIPAGAELLETYGVIMPILIPVSAITLVSTVVVMAISGIVTQAVIRRGKKRGRNDKKEGDAHE